MSPMFTTLKTFFVTLAISLLGLSAGKNFTTNFQLNSQQTVTTQTNNSNPAVLPDPTDKILPPTPTAAGLAKYGEYPVTLNTGTPSISIPIGVAQSGNLSLPVSLSYHASGIRVSEQASWVGLGWSLNAGGVVSRTVKGRPDEMLEGYFDLTHNIPTPTTIDPPNDHQLLKDILDNEKDAEPDLFTYNVGGYSGQFVADRNKNTHTIPQSDVKIDITTDFPNKVIITTPDGTIYTFEEKEYTQRTLYGLTPSYGYAVTSWYLTSITSTNSVHSINITYQSSPGTVIYWQPPYQQELLEYGSMNAPTGYIYTPLAASATQPNGSYSSTTKKPLEIAYDGGKIQFNASATRQDLTNEMQLDDIIIYSENNTILKKYELGYSYYTAMTPVGNVMSGGYSGGDATKRLRLDELQEFGLHGTDAHPKHKFNYNASTLPPINSMAQDYWGFYNSEIYNTNLIPQGDYILVDGTLLSMGGANRTPNISTMDRGMLTSIEYPTGGKTEFVFEPHEHQTSGSYQRQQQVVQAGVMPLQVSTQTVTTGVMAYDYLGKLHYELIIPKDGNGNPYPGAVYSIKVHIKDLTDPSSPGIEYEVSNVHPPITGGDIVIDRTFGLKKGHNYELHAEISSSVTTNGFPGSGAIQITYDAIVPHIINYNKVRSGLRIQQIKNYDDINASNPITTKTYQYTDLTNSSKSSGRYFNFVTDEENMYFNYYEQYGCFPKPGGQGVMAGRWTVINKSSTMSSALSSPSGSPVEYQYVTVVDGDGTGTPNGKAIYEYLVDEEDRYYPPRPGLRDYLVSRAWKRGHLKSETHYDANNNIQQSIVNNYQEFDSGIRITGLVVGENFKGDIPCDGLLFNPSGDVWNCSAMIYDSASSSLVLVSLGDIADCEDNDPNTHCGCQYSNVYNEKYQGAYYEYEYEIGRIALVQSTSTVNGLSTTSSTTYGNNHTNPIEVKTTNSDGTEHITKTKYSFDYDFSNGSSGWQAQGIEGLQYNYQNIPIEQTQYIKKLGSSTPQLVGGSITLFDDGTATTLENPNNQYLPHKMYASELTAPMSSYTPSYINSSGNFVADAVLKEKGTIDEYDNTGNLITYTRTDDRPTSILWGYDKQLPIAKAINATANDVFFTSYESGNYIPITHNRVSNGDAHTGQYALHYDTNETYGFDIKITPDNQNQKFILSLWLKSTANGKILLRSTNGVSNAPYPANVSTNQVIFDYNGTNGEWKHFELELDLDNSRAQGNIPLSQLLDIKAMVWNTGGGVLYIDDVRIRPAKSMMTTITYDHHTRLMNSMADENNTPAFFEYDNFQRLEKAIDFEGNVVSQYNYNYQDPTATNNDQYNYIQAFTALEENLSDLKTAAWDKITENVEYFDGLGRGIQSVAVKQVLKPASAKYIRLCRFKNGNFYAYLIKKISPELNTNNPLRLLAYHHPSQKKS